MPALQQLTGDYWYSLRCVPLAIFSMAPGYAQWPGFAQRGSWRSS